MGLGKRRDKKLLPGILILELVFSFSFESKHARPETKRFPLCGPDPPAPRRNLEPKRPEAANPRYHTNSSVTVAAAAAKELGRIYTYIYIYIYPPPQRPFLPHHPHRRLDLAPRV